MTSLLFALVTQTKLVSPAELYHLVRPAEMNARDCARAWSVEPPAVVICDQVEKLPLGAIPVVFLDDDTDPGALAVHFPGGYSRVHVDRSGALLNGYESVLEGACHEVLEALIDLDCNHWVKHPTREGVEIALEICDPLQTVYPITIGQESYACANFVLRRYFEPPNPNYPPGATFDALGELDGPGYVGPEGYVILRKKNALGDWDNWIEANDGLLPTLSAKKTAALGWAQSRTVRRTGQLFA